MATEATSAPNMFVPGRCSLDSWCLPSVPITRTAYEDASSEFEFETTRHFQDELEKTESLLNQQQLQDKKLAPAVAFADELCCNETVMPLRPPPCLRRINGKGSPLSPPRSPKSPTAVLKVLFKCQSWLSDDFDPFMVALENVKEENEGKFDGYSQEWAQPMSPFQATSPQRLSEDHWLHAHQSGPMVKGSPVKQLAEPKGVLLAKQARLVKMGCEKPNKPKSKKQKIKKFIFRTISVGRTRINEDNQKDKNAAVTMKSSSFKSMAVTEHKEYEGGSQSEMTKLTIIPSRPNLFVCIGYGAKYVK